MRTSCDIDILVRECDVEYIASILVGQHSYIRKGKGTHDISLLSPSGNHIELHYKLVEDRLVNSTSSILDTVWDTATIKDGKKYWYEMPDEMFYFYHITHMAKHFKNGGCGIKPLIDLWLLNKDDDNYFEKRELLLQRGGLQTFSQNASALSRVWFEHETLNHTTDQMEKFILRGGVYGSTENRVAVQQIKHGGKIKYALSKLIIPYNVLELQYPLLNSYRWLTPFFEVYRWISLILKGQAKRSIHELTYNNSISSIDAEKTYKFLKDIGL